MKHILQKKGYVLWGHCQNISDDHRTGIEKYTYTGCLKQVDLLFKLL